MRYLVPNAIRLFFIVFIIGLFGCDNNAASPSVNNQMVLIPEGTYKTSITRTESSGAKFLKSFYIDKHEVTKEQYELCIKENICAPIKSPWPILSDEEYWSTIRSKEPVAIVDWFAAKKYCQSKDKRLPTEREWEKAARGVTGNKNPWGNEPAKIGDSAINKGGPSIVGSFPKDKSAYGVIDLGGNVMEWVEDKYISAKQPLMIVLRVQRGGHWRLIAGSEIQKTDFLAIRRTGGNPSTGSLTVGFRCARDVE